MLEVRDLSISFQKILFHNVSFVCHEGEIVSIYGESGSGKTTFLKFLMGDVVSQSGQLFYYNEEIDENHREDYLFNIISYIDQTGSYFPNMTIYNHFEFYAKTHQIDINQTIVQEYLSNVHLDYISLKKRPSQLSTGERKRFLLALALMMKKKIIIIDEPTASLDQKNVQSLIHIIHELSMKGITFIMTTHDQDIIDHSNVVYKIDDCQLVKCKNHSKEDQKQESIIKKPVKVRYSRYKNLKLRILMIVLICIGGCTLAFVSRTIASYMSIRDAQSSQLQVYKNNYLYLSKATDPRHDLSEWNLLGLGGEISEVDVISSEEIDRIKQIDGVIDVKPTYYIEKHSTDSLISVYQNNELIKEVTSYACGQENYCFNRDIFVTAYYPEENIKKNGDEIKGIYVNEVMEEILDMPSYNDLQISFIARAYKGLSYRTNEYELPILDPQFSTDMITIDIDGVLTQEEYNDGRHDSCGRIYMPIDQFRLLVDNQIRPLFKESDMPFESRQYMIICEDDKDEEVKLEIEGLNELYYALNNKITRQEFIDYVNQQNTSSVFMMIGMNIVFISGLMLIVGYYTVLRSKEVPMLKKEGLLRYIRAYYREDNIELMLGWIVISGLCIPLAIYYLELFRDLSYVSVYVGIWLITTVSLGLIVIVLKNVIQSYMIKKVVLKDK